MDKPFDRMSYSCMHCGHNWLFGADKLATNEQVETWFAEIQIEHYAICSHYRELMGKLPPKEEGKV